MANENKLGFKRGLQGNLDQLTSSEDGIFYLTTDTNRLYVGKGKDKKPVLVNNTIISANSLSDIDSPVDGEYYYITGSNILAYRDGEKWVQLNPNSDTKITAASFKKNNIKSDGTKLIYDLTLSVKDVNDNPLNDVTTQLEISSEDVTGITTETAVDVKADARENVATITTSGAGASGTGFAIKAGDNVTIEKDDDDIKISAKDTTYTLGSAANSTKVTLTADGANQDVTFKAGTDITLNGAVDKQIEIKHAAITTTPADGTPTTLTHKGTFSAITGITAANGHVTGYETTEFTLPEDTNNIIDSVAVTTANNGGLNVKVADNKGVEKTGTLTEGLYYTFGAEKVYNQGDLSNSKYLSGLKDKVDTLEKDLASIDALRYRGPVNKAEDLPSANVQIGDTYKVATAGIYGSLTCGLGDLLIATGTEDDNGYITAATLEWTLVASGAETDTTYKLSGASNKIILTGSTDSGTNSGEIRVEDGTDISSVIADNKLTVSHKNVTRDDGTAVTTELNHGDTLTVITAVETSATGHVEAAKKTTFTLPVDKDTTYTLPAGTVTKNTAAKITLTALGGATDVVNFEADQTTNTSLKVNATADTITYAHEDYDYTAPTGVTATGTLAHGSELTVVTGADVTNGHVTGLKTTTYTLPTDNDSKYTLSGTTAAAATVTGRSSAVKLTSTLTGSGSAAGATSTSETTISSESLVLTAGTKGYNIDIEWGTF